MSAVSPAYARTRIGLCAAAFLAPFSATHLAGPLTVGRVAALFFAALLAADLLRQRPRRFRPDAPTVMLVVGYLGLCAWAFLSAKTVGCNCEGKAGGLFELTVVGLLAVVAIGVEPRLRDSTLLAALAGATLAAALALAGVGAINSGTVDLTDTGGRLSGSYGNANELGLAAALGVPVALAYLVLAGRRVRWALLGAIAILVLALALTYSRGGIIAAGAGVLALALWEATASRRRLALTLGTAVVAVVVAVVLYSFFEERREDASFAPPPVALRPLDQRDVSGWDSRGLGPIPHGPSLLRSGNGGIVVHGSRRGEGASFRWGEALPGHTYVLKVSVATAGTVARSRIAYALADRVAGGGVARVARLGPGRQTLSLLWRPRLRAPHAALFLWQPDARAGFAVAGAQVTERVGGAEVGTVFAPTRLRGSVYAHLGSDASKLEDRYVESRLDAARLALRAFRSAPVEGIGWSTFPSYSATRADYGRLAAHDQYLLIAAELGAIGLAFLALLIAAPVLGARRSPPDSATAAAIGLLAGAAAGMVFVETLASPHLAIPIALAAATLTARFRATG
jgi:O-Antigen ligase